MEKVILWYRKVYSVYHCENCPPLRPPLHSKARTILRRSEGSYEGLRRYCRSEVFRTLRLWPLAIFLLILFAITLASCAAIRTHYMDSLKLNLLKDGTYIGQDTNLMCNVKVSTTVKDRRITEIKILRKFFTYPLAARAYAKIPQRIVKEQSLDVDAVTAATVSSNSIKRAVLQALKKAQD